PVTPVDSVLQEPSTPDSDEITDLNRITDARRIFFSTVDQSSSSTGPLAVQPQVAPEVTAQWTLAGQAAMKLGVHKPGWDRVTQNDLVAAGFDAAVDAHNLQLFADGVEQAITVNGEGDGQFDSGDSIEFYGTGVDTAFTDTRTYWLVAGPSAGRRIATAP